MLLRDNQLVCISTTTAATTSTEVLPDLPLQEEVKFGIEDFSPALRRELLRGVPLHNGEKLLSIVIPAFNEEHRIAVTLASYREQLLEDNLFSDISEIIIVDDGSSDRTCSVAKVYSSPELPVRIVQHQHNRGKGAALRTGVEHCEGLYILLADADGSTPLQELAKLYSQMQDGAGIAIGSRSFDSYHGSEVSNELHRRAIGSVFRFLTQLIALSDLKDLAVRDTQCGFKLIDRFSASLIFPELTIDGFAIDVELLRVAAKRGIPVKEVAINWHNVDGSKVNLLTAPLSMLIGLFRVRFSH